MINKIQQKYGELIISPAHEKFIITIQSAKTREIIYEWESESGVFCSAERIDKVDSESATIEGNCQHFAWGHPAKQVFALDQLRQFFAKMTRQEPAFLKLIRDFFKKS
jgi:hypothetical protein